MCALLLLAGCGKSAGTTAKKMKIGVSVPSATHGWTGGVVWNAQEAKKKVEAANPDVEVMLATSANAADQVKAIEALTMQNPDALVVLSQEPEPLQDVCKRAKDAGAFLVIVSNPLPNNVQDIFVNGDNTSLGEAAGEAMGQALKGSGKIVVMEGILCPINTERVTGFRTVLARKYPGIQIMESQPAEWNTEKGLKLMENYLQKYPQIDGVWAGDDDVLIGALKAYQESGRKDVKVFVGGGGAKNIVKMVLDNNTDVKATVTYPPDMVAVGVEKALNGLRNGKKDAPGEEAVIIKSELVTPVHARNYYFPDSPY